MKIYFLTGIYIFTTAILLSSSSCIFIKKYIPAQQDSGEQAIANDAVPPDDYNPIFINKVAEYTKSDKINYKANIIGTEIDSGKVKVYFNIVDTNGTAYIKANDPKFKTLWCLLEEEIDNIKYPVENYKIHNYTETDKIPYAFGLVLDHSGSMGISRAYTVQNAISNLIKNIKRPDDAFGVVKYDNQTIIEVPLTKDSVEFSEKFKIDGLNNFGGWTAINDGIIKATDMLSQYPGYKFKAVVVFTDGLENKSTNSKQQAIDKINQAGYQLFAIDFGANIDTAYMKSIAEQTGGCYYHIYQTSEFNQVFTDIYKRMKNVYVLEYTPSMFGKVNFKLEICHETGKVSLNQNFEYKPEKGNFTLVNIYFDTGKSAIKDKYKSEVERLTKIMKTYPELIIEIGGHTDDVGTEESNQKLSQERAEAVMNAIIKNGVDASRITAKGYGESVPIEDNKTKEGRSKNRRTEFLIIQN